MVTAPKGVALEQFGPTITVGEILVDIMAGSIGKGFLEPLTLTGPFPSGAPAIFIDQIACMGSGAGIIAAVGDDDFGRLNLKRMSDDGVDISAISIIKDRPTGTAFVRYCEDGSRDFIFNITHSAAGMVTMNAAADALVERAGHFHIMGSAFAIDGFANIIRTAMKKIRTKGGSVSFDPNIRKELLESHKNQDLINDVLSQVDILFPSGDELLAITGETNNDIAIKKLLNSGITEIVLKEGSQGATVHRLDMNPLHMPAYIVDEIDPTGAGDCFGATYLTCRRRGLPVDVALKYANASGALTVSQCGPMEGTANMKKLDAFIAQAKVGSYAH